MEIQFSLSELYRTAMRVRALPSTVMRIHQYLRCGIEVDAFKILFESLAHSDLVACSSEHRSFRWHGDLAQMHLEETTAHVHRRDDLEERARVEEDLSFLKDRVADDVDPSGDLDHEDSAHPGLPEEGLVGERVEALRCAAERPPCDPPAPPGTCR